MSIDLKNPSVAAAMKVATTQTDTMKVFDNGFVGPDSLAATYYFESTENSFVTGHVEIPVLLRSAARQAWEQVRLCFRKRPRG